jgi:hypothetical protein
VALAFDGSPMDIFKDSGIVNADFHLYTDNQESTGAGLYQT